MRICSLLPSATEMLFALGLGDQLVGVSHECDFPPDAATKPRLTRSLIDETQASDSIHGAVTQALAQRRALYELNLDLLQKLKPDLIVTQDLCNVCALNADDVAARLGQLPNRPELLALHPHTIEEMLDDILVVGRATHRVSHAETIVAQLRNRIQRVQRDVAGTSKPKVVCLEWLDPLMSAGHWVPQQVAWAEGQEQLGRAGQPSQRVEWAALVEAQPDVLVLMPCGLSMKRTREELPVLMAHRSWNELLAVRRQRVWIVDGPSYFNRSGPRLIDGIELLADLLHPSRPHHAAAAQQARAIG